MAANKPGCLQGWLFAPPDAEWHLPDTGAGRAIRGRRQAGIALGWHLSPLPILLTLLKVPSSGPCDICPLSCFMLLMEN